MAAGRDSLCAERERWTGLVRLRCVAGSPGSRCREEQSAIDRRFQRQRRGDVHSKMCDNDPVQHNSLRIARCRHDPRCLQGDGMTLSMFPNAEASSK